MQDSVSHYVVPLIQNDISLNGLIDCKIDKICIFGDNKTNAFVKSNLKYFTVWVNEKETKVIQKLKNQSNMSGYIRKLVHDDIEKNGLF